MSSAAELHLFALPDFPHVTRGDDLAAFTVAALTRANLTLRDDDVLVFAQKVISKAEGRVIDLATVEPTAQAAVLALTVQKDPRLVELVLRESQRIVRAAKDVLIVEHRLGLIMANAGIDQSNVDHPAGGEFALLLPEDPDGSATRLRERLRTLAGCEPGIVISDSFGRPWRVGTVGVAIGCAGIAATLDLRGEKDLFGRTLRVTVVGHADEIASAASLLMGQASEARPVILVRGVNSLRATPSSSRTPLAARSRAHSPAASGPVPMTGHVVALCGGVGGAKLAHGLSLALPPENLSIIVNTGDDFQHLGLSISPDLDSVVYALAELSDPVRGWGRREETWTFMAALEGLGGDTWFRLGDGDLAMHVERSHRLAQGATLSEVTAHLCRALGIAARVLPMSDDPVRTRVLTGEGWLDFQEYFVHRQCRPAVKEFRFEGAGTARAQPDALAALERADLRAIIICPSNPFVSVEPILAVPGIRAAIQQSASPIVAVTPIIGGKAIKGPAAKMLAELGLDVSGEAIARRYGNLIDGFIVDDTDPWPQPLPGVTFFRAATLMSSTDDRIRLAHAALQIADALAATA